MPTFVGIFVFSGLFSKRVPSDLDVLNINNLIPSITL